MSHRRMIFTRVAREMSVEEEIHRGVYASVVRTGKGTAERMFTLQGDRGSRK